MKTLAAFLLIAAQTAPAAQQCLPPAQAGQLAAALVPALIDSAARHCAAHLPAGAFLGDGSRALSERIRADTAPLRASAAAAVLALTGQAEPAPGQDPDQMIGVLADGMAEALDAPKCRSANQLFEALAPLPTANLGQLFSAILGAGATESAGGEDGAAICPA